ncbi:MAG: type II toxin-antitoxin system VapC family toxin [Verrucomicrobiota bacterium]
METITLNALLDTHALVWALIEPERLAPDATALIEASQPEDIAISDMTLLEVALLAQKGRLNLNETTESLLSEMAQLCRVLPINASIAAGVTKLALPQSDPFDRTIVATAQYHQLPLITKDRHISESGCVKTIW